MFFFQPGKFWGTLARSRLTWDTDFHTDMDCDFQTGKFNWFTGGKLNVSGENLFYYL